MLRHSCVLLLALPGLSTNLRAQGARVIRR